MFKKNGAWASHFCHESITLQNSVVAVVAMDKGHGGHSFILTEFIDSGGNAKECKLDLTTPDDHEVEILINEWTPQDPDKSIQSLFDYLGGDGRSLVWRHWVVTMDQLNLLFMAANRFAQKASIGRYTYFLPGGGIGKVKGAITTITNKPEAKQRAVNCSDFAIKVLGEAGIAKLTSLVFNTPKRIASAN